MAAEEARRNFEMQVDRVFRCAEVPFAIRDDFVNALEFLMAELIDEAINSLADRLESKSVRWP